jgi:hypothetical protein
MNRQKRRDTVLIPFKVVLSQSAATSNILSPALTSRLAAIADDYEEYRFTELRFRLTPNSANGPAACYLPGIIDTPPTTAATILECLESVYLGAASTVPTQWCVVPKSVLAGMHTWYKTIPGTPASAEELQGGIYVFASAATNVEITGVCEFAAAAAGGNTPLERALASRRREKQRIVSLLASTDGALPGKH